MEASSFTLENPIKEGYTFAGWTGSGLSQASTSVEISNGTTGNLTYTANWISNNFDLKGTIKDDSDIPNILEGVEVKIVKGTKQYGETAITNSEGQFTIENIEAGTYNLIMTYDQKTEIVEVNVLNNVHVTELGVLTYQLGNASSVLVLKGDDTPAVVIDNLHPEAKEYYDAGAPELFVKVEMTVKKTDPETAESDELVAVQNIRTLAQKKQYVIGLYVDMIVDRFKRESEEVEWNFDRNVAETEGLVKVIIPLPEEIQGKEHYIIYRYHNNQVNDITEIANANGEYLELNESDWTLTLYVKMFSVYGIGYLSDTPASNNSSSSNTTRKYTVTFDENGGLPETLEKVVVEGNLLDKPENPVREGYEFLGWAKEDGETWDFEVDTVKANTLLIAQWEEVILTDPIELDRVNHIAYMQGYPDLSFRANNNMTRAEVTIMFARLMIEKMNINETYKSEFNDVDHNKWYSNGIGYMKQFGIVKGNEDGSFRPDSPITRAEFVAITCKFIDAEDTLDISFSDISSHWAKSYIEKAAMMGWINGYEDGTFKPDQYITRAEVVTITNRILDRKFDEVFGQEHKDSISKYNDLSSDFWAYKDIMEASIGHKYSKTGSKETWLELSE